MESVSARVEALLSQMTSAEKASQLAQLFSFKLPGAPDPALNIDTEAQPTMVEAALRNGGVG